MDSPIRKQLKRNDYLRHKVFRKINRRRRAEKEQEESMPERELRRRLRRMRKYGDGKDSGIHIKPSKRGTFTAAAKRRGMTVKQLTSAVLRQPGKYSKAMRKKALFARNASKWKK